MEKQKLISDRLYFDEFQGVDENTLIKYLNNKRIYEMTLHIPYPYTKDDATSFIAYTKKAQELGTTDVFAIRLKETKELIGCMSLGYRKEYNDGEVAYWIAEPYWNKGYASEALQSILSYAFTSKGYDRVFAYTFLMNGASQKVLIKNRLLYKETQKEKVTKEGQPYDLHLYEITRTTCKITKD